MNFDDSDVRVAALAAVALGLILWMTLKTAWRLGFTQGLRAGKEAWKREIDSFEW